MHKVINKIIFIYFCMNLTNWKYFALMNKFIKLSNSSFVTLCTNNYQNWSIPSLFIIIRMEMINFQHSTLSLQIFDLRPNYHNSILSNASPKLRKYFKRNRLTLQLEARKSWEPTLIDISDATDQVYENKFQLSIKARPIYKMTPSKSNRIYLVYWNPVTI